MFWHVSVCVSVQRGIPRPGPSPRYGGGYPILPDGGTPTFPMGGGTKPKTGWGIPPLGPEWNYPPSGPGWGYPFWTGWHLDRLCHGRYASWGFPQEYFLVLCNVFPPILFEDAQTHLLVYSWLLYFQPGVEWHIRRFLTRRWWQWRAVCVEPWCHHVIWVHQQRRLRSSSLPQILRRILVSVWCHGNGDWLRLSAKYKWKLCRSKR